MAAEQSQANRVAMRSEGSGTIEAAPTPGPWKAISDPSWYPWDGAIEIRGADGSPIAWLGAGSNETVDARLIAAAPQMLDALKFALTIIGHPDDAGAQLIASIVAEAEGRS